MIDATHETLFSLSEAAKSLPRRRRGRKPHVSCLYRWSVSGCRGIVLETIQVGGTRCTSREALARFFEALTYGAPDAQSHRPRTPAARQRAAERAARELQREGV
jgi:hypothetical protein